MTTFYEQYRTRKKIGEKYKKNPIRFNRAAVV